MNFDIKEKCMIERYKLLFESFTFDEIHVYAFYIFIRDKLGDRNNKQYEYIKDFGDLIAHRNRKQGIAMTCIKMAINNKYQTIEGKRAVIGYNGIDEQKWIDQWKSLGEKLNINFSDKCIREITICSLSILQFSEYKNNDYYGVIQLLQSYDGQLLACTTEGKDDSPYIIFAKIDNLNFQKLYKPIIEEPIFAVREEGKLRLINEKNEYII